MPKPRRTRDYRAEEARRNARARARGFTSRAAERTARRQGWTPDSGVTGRTFIPQGLKGLARMRREAQAWSRIHSRQRTSRYRTSMTPAQVRAYHAAYIAEDTRANRIENELYALRDYLVDTMGYYEDAEFDDRYDVTYIRNIVRQHESPELSRRLGNDFPD